MIAGSLRPAWRRRLAPWLAFVITLYGAVLRIDALVGRYGVVDRPTWVRGIERLAPVGGFLKPRIYAWPPVTNPYVGGDPISYLAFARDMQSFYQPHVREPVFLALTRGWLWLLNNQNIAVSFASLTGSIATIPGTYLLGTAVCSPAVGLLAAAAWAIDYDAIGWAPDGWRDDTFTATFVFAVWALVRMRQRPAIWRGVLAGALGALACLTRLSALSFLLPCWIWVELTVQDTWGRGLRVVAVAAGVTVLLVAPYVINCARAFGDPLVAVNAHTRYYRFSEGLPSDRPENAARYLSGKFQRRPVYEADTAIEGLFVRPLTNKWSGFDAWIQGASALLMAMAIVGLALLAATADGRLVLIACFTSLIPFAFTWNIAGGGEWRFTMHVYPVFLIAAFVPLAIAWRARRPEWRHALANRRRDVGLALGCALLIALLAVVRGQLPYYVTRETLAMGQPANFMAGPRDGQFFTHGWSPWHTDGNVTVRVTVGERAQLTIPLPTAAEYLLTLRADPIQPDRPQTLALLFNRQLLRTVPLDWNPSRVGTYRVTIPARYTHPGANELLIVPASTILAREAGERFRWIDPGLSIGSRVWYVRVEPVTDTPRTSTAASPGTAGQI